MQRQLELAALPLMFLLALSVAPAAYATTIFYPLDIEEVNFIDIDTGEEISAVYSKGETTYIGMLIATGEGYAYTYTYADAPLDFLLIAAIDYPAVDPEEPDTQIFYLVQADSVPLTAVGIEREFLIGFQIPMGSAIPTGTWNVRVMTMDDFPWNIPSNALSLPDNENLFEVTS